MASLKSDACVRFVVPTSTNCAPALRITSGMRNAPPISTSSPRDTMTSRRRASVLSMSSTAAALLFTTVADSAPVSSQSKACTKSSRSPRRPEATSNSRLTGAVSARTTDSTAVSGSNARPRLVCSTVPDKLNTGRICARVLRASLSSTSLAIACGFNSSAKSSAAIARDRNCASSVRSAATTGVRA